MGDVCIIGAGSSGIAACQALQARGIDFDCFEKGSGVGGNWRYENDNGMSAAYRSLFINTSRRTMQYRCYPMPEDLPDFPHHTQIAAYFDDFVDHFGLRERITFNTEVSSVEPADGGGWTVTLDDGTTRRYRAVLVANGHHWDRRWPDFPGEFDGKQMHAHDYRTPEGFEDRNVLVVGMGNSAMDIASETSRVSRMTYLSARRGAWVIPKYILGKPLTDLVTPLSTRLPFRVQQAITGLLVRLSQGRMEDYGLPKPDHRIGEAHPTVSSELLPRIGHGRVTVKPDIERLMGDRVRFVDGSEERIDVIVYGTGYNITFPFLAPDVLATTGNRVHLCRNVVHPDRPGLYFIGLVQPFGAIMPIAEAQSEWVADLIEGRARLPSRERMVASIERDARRLRKRYVASKRHTIQVDFYPYLRELRRERRRRARGAGAGAAHV